MYIEALSHIWFLSVHYRQPSYVFEKFNVFSELFVPKQMGGGQNLVSRPPPTFKVREQVSFYTPPLAPTFLLDMQMSKYHLMFGYEK